MATTNARQKRKCKKKKAYPTHEAAKEGMLTLKNAQHIQLWMDVYKCALCGKYHVGHQRKNRRFTKPTRRTR